MIVSRRVIVIALALAGVAGPSLFAQAVAPRPKGVFRPKGPVRARKQLERLDKMTPEERQQFLNRLPPERRAEAERRIEQYHKLTPDERDRLAKGYERLQSMPPERRAHLRRLYQQFNDIPLERRTVLRQELQGLRKLDDDGRRDRMNSDEFRNKYSATEQKLLADLSRVLDPDE